MFYFRTTIFFLKPVRLAIAGGRFKTKCEDLQFRPWEKIKSEEHKWNVYDAFRIARIEIESFTYYACGNLVDGLPPVPILNRELYFCLNNFVLLHARVKICLTALADDGVRNTF